MTTTRRPLAALLALIGLAGCNPVSNPPAAKDDSLSVTANVTRATAGHHATTSTAAHDFIFDFPEVQVGTAEYEDGPTGATVFYFPDRVMAAVDARGGDPATVNLEALKLGYEEKHLNGLVFAGGSGYGIATAAGVVEALKSVTPHAARWDGIAGVSGAMINDLAPRRATTVTPDAELGRAAFGAARAARFPLGAHGAGRFAMQGAYFNDMQHSGQGAAMRTIGPTRILVFTVVNATGMIVDRTGRIARCNAGVAPACGTIADRFAHRIDALAPGHESAGTVESGIPNRRGSFTGNTTLTLVVTNQILDYASLQRLAIQVHTSMARAIQPFQTADDGDVLFAVTTRQISNPNLGLNDLASAAGEVAWDAVLNSLPDLDPPVAASSDLPSSSEVATDQGRYDFGEGNVVTVSQSGSTLSITMTAGELMYFPKKGSVNAKALNRATFEVENGRHDHIVFDHDRGGRVVGMTVNPGQWALHANRIK